MHQLPSDSSPRSPSPSSGSTCCQKLIPVRWKLANNLLTRWAFSIGATTTTSTNSKRALLLRCYFIFPPLSEGKAHQHHHLYRRHRLRCRPWKSWLLSLRGHYTFPPPPPFFATRSCGGCSEGKFNLAFVLVRHFKMFFPSLNLHPRKKTVTFPPEKATVINLMSL